MQFKQNNTWLLYSKHQNSGFTKTRMFSFTDSEAKTAIRMQTKWTEGGIKFIHELLKKVENEKSSRILILVK